jgi:hypothetical protein
MMMKCRHGVYIPQGVFDGKSPSCSGCHPENAHIIFTGHRVALGIILERVVDSADYITRPLGERLVEYANLTEEL